MDFTDDDLEDDVEAINANFFAKWLDKMDNDVAARFVLSGVSLKRNKILEAFDTACNIMHIRESQRSESYESEANKAYSELAAIDVHGLDETSKDFLEKVDGLIKNALGDINPDKKKNDE